MVLKPRLAAERMTHGLRDAGAAAGGGARPTWSAPGVKVDRAILSRLTSTFAQRIARLEEEIYELAGHKFNLGSPKQLGEFLFDSLKLPGGRKTKTGQWETRANLLDDLAAREDLPEQASKLINVMLEWRQLAKLRSTYTDSLPQHINRGDGPHPYLLCAGVHHDGRLASTDPNLQNIPIRTKEGREIRTAFIAERGHKLISADYSQIELRVLAHVADIPQLKKAFEEGLDIHAMTASEMFGVAIEGMPPEVRRRAKAINFGIIYGISAFGLAAQLGISEAGGGRVHRHTISSASPAFATTWKRPRNGARAGVCGDHFRPARALPGNQYQEPVDARVSGARRHQCADPGLGRRYHPPGHDPHATGIGRRRGWARCACYCRCTTSWCSRARKPRSIRP